MNKYIRINKTTHTVSENYDIISDATDAVLSRICSIMKEYKGGSSININSHTQSCADPFLMKKWTDFNQKVFAASNIKSIFIENTPSVINSLAWIFAIESSADISFANSPESADLAIVSLRALSEGHVAISDYKNIISVGNEKVDFNEIKKLAPETLWVNYYGLPYCFCVSFAQEAEILGKKDILHQLKPISGLSAFASDNNGNIIPENVIGALSQEHESSSSITPYKAIMLSGSKLYALGCDDEHIISDGLPIKKRFIEDTLLRSSMVDDCAAGDGVVFYTQSHNVTAYSISKYLQDSGLGSIILREVPYIPTDIHGNSAVNALTAFTELPFSELDNLNKTLKNGFSGDHYCYVDYENISDSVLSAEQEHNTDVLSESTNIVDEPAFLSTAPIDYSKCLYNNLSDIIKGASDSEQKIVYIGPNGRHSQTYKELYAESLLFADGLRAHNIKAGDTIVLQIPDNHDYLVAFWGCILVGAASAPLGVLDDYGNNNLNSEKLYNICRLIENVYIIADDKIAEPIRELISTDNVISYSDINGTSAHEELNHVWHDDDTCLMLFTSGSTGIPKGVELSQKNVFARTLGEIEMYGFDSNISDFNWMTLTHAAGIIWTHIRDTYLKAFQVQADTNTILNNPLSYFDYLTEFKTTTSWAPNFAYALLTKSIDEAHEYNWDLSHATNIYSTAEANVASTLRSFLKKTAKYGMSQNAMIPCFGMTETSSVMIYYNGFSLDTSSDDQRFVPIGELAVGHSARITDDNGNILKRGEIGKIELLGDTVTCGYHKNPEANEESFTSDGFFITGDSGYIDGKNIVLTGRIKEMIIINGLNYYVQDIESVVDETEGVSTSYTAALSVKSNSGAEEILIVFTPEKETLSGDEMRELTALIRNNLLERSGLYAKYIVPDFKTNSLRTELGKKQRSKYRNNFYEGKYDAILRETGVIKEEPYIMSENVVRYKLKGNVTVDEYDIIDESGKSGNKTAYIDEFAINCADNTYDAFMEKLLEHGKLWGHLPTNSRVVLPIKSGRIISGNEAFNINSSLVSGFVRSFNIENPDKKVIIADFDDYNPELAKKELFSTFDKDEVFYRNSERYIREFQTLTSESRLATANDIFSGKAILVAGGMGGIGINLCRHLAEKYSSDLLITGRKEADEEKLTMLSKASGNAAKVVYIKADASDKAQIAHAVNEFQKQTGRNIDVIINLTGTIDCADGTSYWEKLDSHTVSSESESTFKHVVNSKLLTTTALAEFAVENNVKKFISFGSLNGILGGSGLSAYSSANSFQDRFTSYLNTATDVDAYCINWCGWYGTGLSSKTPDYIINVSQASGFRFTDVTENLSYFDKIMENDIKSCIVGMDRNNPKNRVMVNDDYAPVIDVFYSGHDADIRALINGERHELTVNLLKPENIARNSAASADVNLSELKNSVINTNRTVSEMNEDEKKMAEVWKKVLGCSNVDADRSFFELGGNSLLLTKLTYNISNELGIDVTTQDIMIYKNIRKLVEHINSASDSDKNDISSIIGMINSDIDIKELLPDDIEKLDKGSDENAVLIAAIDDIRSAFIISEICQKYPDRQKYILLNAVDNNDAYDIYSNMLEKYGLKADIESSLLNVIAADITKANFGLSAKEYSALCKNVSTVFHCSIDTNLVSSYEALRNCNITGTKNIISFCCTDVNKKLIFLSSVAVFRNVSAEAMPLCDENSDILPSMLKAATNRDFHYSVYAADKLVQLAHKKGIDVQIIRCGRISGSTSCGIINSDDIIWRLIKFFTDSKIMPEINAVDEPMTPVDILAEQILDISLINNSDNYIYHLKGIEATTKEILKWVKKRYPDIRIMPLKEWKELILNTPKYNSSTVSVMLGHFSEENETPTAVSDELTKSLLRANSIRTTDNISLDETLDTTYSYLLKTGFIANRSEGDI